MNIPDRKCAVLLAINSGCRKVDIEAIKSHLPTHNYKCLQGVHKGKSENAYLFICEPDELNMFIGFATLHGQACILYLDQRRNAFTVDCKLDGQYGKQSYIGQFRSVTGAVAVQQDCYTFDPTQQNYYIVR